MRFAQIEQFIAIVEAGSIRAAARRLEMSQPALTRSLQQLEQDLGVQLLRRTTRGIALTSAGASFLARARVADSEMRKAAEEARRTVATEGGLVSMALSPVAATLLLPELVTSLRARHPASRIRIMEMAPSAVLPLVRDEVADIGVTQRTRAGTDAGLKFKPLFEVQMRVAARPGHSLAGARRLGDLQAASWLAMTVPGSAEDIASQSFARLGLAAPVPALHCGSYSVSLELVATSDLLTVLPPNVLRAWIEAGRLAEITLDKPILPLLVGSYTRADTPATPLARSAVQFIGAIARRLNETDWLRTSRPLAGPDVASAAAGGAGTETDA